MVAPLPSPHVVHIPTGASCNNRCTFCMERSLGYPVKTSFEEHRRSLERLRAELDGVVFTGGEPTLNPLLPRLIRAARELDYREIGLVTNGRALFRRALTEELLAAGLTRVTLSIHGPDAVTHDGIVRRRGAFAQALAGLENLVALRARYPHRVDVNCTLVRANLTAMRATRDLVLGAGAASVNFNVVEPRGTAEELFDEVVPTYAEVMEHAAKSGLDFSAPEQSLSRVPPCAGGGEWVQETFHLAQRHRVDVYDAREGKVKGAPCAECAAAASCDGIWEGYATRRGWTELVPLTRAEPARSDTLPKAMSERRLDLKLGFACNNRCVFCAQGEKRSECGARPVEDLVAELDAARDECSGVVLTGGEPTLYPKLRLVVKAARRLGYRHVQLQTNGRALSNLKLLGALVEAGLTEVSPSLHGASAATHDALTLAPGSFAQSTAGMKNAAAAGLPVVTNTVVTQRNLDELPAIVSLLASLGVRNAQLAFVHPVGTAYEKFDEVVPRLSDCVEPLRAARAIALERGVGLVTEAVPLCFLPGMQELAVEWRIPATTVADISGRLDYSTWRVREGKAHGPPCADCSGRSRCEGPWREYPERRGWDEFRPLAPV